MWRRRDPSRRQAVAHAAIGTLERYPNQSAAERACKHLRLAANQQTFNPECPSMGGLIDRYIEQVLKPCIDVPIGGTQDSSAPISYHCAKSYRSALNRWVSGPAR